MGLDAEVLFMFIRINHHACILLMFVGLSLSTSCNNQNLDTSRLDNLENNTIATINQQLGAITSSLSDLKEMSKTIEECVNSLSDESEDMKALIVALQSATYSLQEQIKELEAYVDSELSSTRNWANATFATLEQYASIQTEISAIKTLLNESMADLTAQYKVAIETAISDSETSMKSWVNTQLAQGYYNIAAIDGKVSALESLISEGDSKLQVQINEQKEALKQAKNDLTNEYKQYINQAIAAGGIINQAIAAQVKAAQDNLQAQIDAVNSKIDSLKDRLGKLEEDFVNRIQSLKYIPEYSDGKVLVSDIFRMRLTADFIVTPSSQAKIIKEAWVTNKDIVKAYLRYTKSPETRATSSAIPLDVTAIDVSETGVLTVYLTESKDTPVDADHWCKNFKGIIYIQVSDGNSDIISDFVNIETFINDLSHIEDRDVFNDLSPFVNGKYQTANCYLLNNSGLYKFKAYEGNTNNLVGSQPYIHPEGNPSSAVVVWESRGVEETQVGDVLTAIKYLDEYIYFRTPENFTEGNALIAIKNEEGNILWSWHIWITEKPKECVSNYKTSGAEDAIFLMDRNLGATSSDIGDAGALGLLYQWGRKDPFLGEQNSSIKWPSSVKKTETTSTIRYVITHPTTYVNTYGMANTPWSNDSNNAVWKPEKTTYDPCPYGWRVPDTDNLYPDCESCEWDSKNKGRLFTGNYGSGFTIWYPLTGYREVSGGSYSSGYYGRYWSSEKKDNSQAYCFDFDDRSWYTSSLITTYGLAVRCQKE